MRILHIVKWLSDRGNGIVNAAVDIAIEQQRSGHTVAFIAAPGGHEPLVRSEGVQVFSVDQERRLLNLPKASLRIRRVLREFKPDIVHAHMQTGLALALPWTKLYRIPTVGHLHNVHDRTARRMGWADRLITVSSAVQRTMEEQGVPAAKIRVVLNGTIGSARRLPTSSLTPETLLRPAITTVAGMSHRKGIAELIQAFDRIAGKVPAAHLYIAGEGPERELFEQQARASAAHERIHFIGFHEAPQRLMLGSDIFVLASRRDSCPLVIPEAREAGCAIVASNVDGIPEALDYGEAGILVPPQSPAELASALLQLLTDTELREGWRSRAHAGLERFTVARMTREMIDVYREIARNGRGERQAASPSKVSIGS